MPKPVKCRYCNNTFDRDKEAYVKPASNRYAHATCYLRLKAENSKTPELEIIDPTLIVTCIYCKKEFNKENTEYEIIGEGKYVHKSCKVIEEKRELTDQEKLSKLIIELYDLEFVPPRVQKQIKDYMQKYNYTYSGILKTLEYMHFIKKLPIDKIAFNTYGIGLVKNYYSRAHDYYYAIWEAQQNQIQVLATCQFEDFVPKQVEVTIPTPKRQVLKRNLFSFLDAEEEE